MNDAAPGPSDRTRRFLANLDIDEALVAAAARRVVIEIFADSLDPPTETAVAMTAILLLRLADYAPIIRLAVPAGRTTALPCLPDAPLAEALLTAHAEISSADRITTGPAGDSDLRLVFSGSAPGVKVATAGWTVSIGQPVDGTGNGLAAAYAGVLAAAEAFKTLLASAGALPARSRPWRGAISLWDFSATASAGPPLQEIHVPDHAWVGAGGVASATAWALAALHHTGTTLTGRGQVVDDEAIDQGGTNLNRYLIAVMADRNSPKASLLAATLTSCGLTLEPLPRRWETLPQEQRHPALAIVSVDDDKVRREVQHDMPATVLNAGTGDQGTYQASTHNYLDRACAACISRADLSVSSPESRLTVLLGIPFETLRPLLRNSDPLPEAILAAATLTAEERAEAARIPARDLLQRFCDKLQLPDGGPAVSAPMLSAAAGVLLAAHIARHAHPQSPAQPGQVVRTSILTGPHSRWLQHREKTPGCHCTDPIYTQHYQKRWPG